MSLYNSDLIESWREPIGLEDTQIGKIIDKASFKTSRKISKILLGLTSHPVFMDSHFERL